MSDCIHGVNYRDGVCEQCRAEVIDRMIKACQDQLTPAGVKSTYEQAIDEIEKLSAELAEAKEYIRINDEANVLLKKMRHKRMEGCPACIGNIERAETAERERDAAYNNGYNEGYRACEREGEG